MIHEEKWIWILVGSGEGTFNIEFPPDELFDEPLDTQVIEGIEEVTMTAIYKEDTLFVKFPTEDVFPVVLKRGGKTITGEGQIVMQEPEGEYTIVLRMVKQE